MKYEPSEKLGNFNLTTGRDIAEDLNLKLAR
jgi:hypothetical protein